MGCGCGKKAKTGTSKAQANALRTTVVYANGNERHFATPQMAERALKNNPGARIKQNA